MFYGQTMFSESRRFQSLRYGTGIIVTILYLSYLVHLISQVIKDEPLIQTSYEYLDKLNIPDIEICGDWSDIEISRCTFNWNNQSSTTFEACNDPFSRQIRIEDIKHCYLYTSNDTYVYGNNDTNHKGPWVKSIDFYFKIKNITAVTSKFLSVGTITVQLMDPEFDPLWKNSTISTDIDNRIKQELQLMNGFAGIQNMSTLVYFRKTTFQTILPNDVPAIIGGTPNYHNTSYLTSISKNFPMHQNESFTDTGHFNIAPGSFTHEVKSEKRSRTVFSMLGLAGGAFGAIAGIYTLLFGQPRNNPWGIMHRLAKLEIKNNSDLQNLPFVTVINSTQNYKVPTKQRVTRLENRIWELERILEDYVFNPSILKWQGERRASELKIQITGSNGVYF